MKNFSQNSLRVLAITVFVISFIQIECAGQKIEKDPVVQVFLDAGFDLEKIEIKCIAPRKSPEPTEFISHSGDSILTFDLEIVVFGHWEKLPKPTTIKFHVDLKLYRMGSLKRFYSWQKRLEKKGKTGQLADYFDVRKNKTTIQSHQLEVSFTLPRKIDQKKGRKFRIRRKRLPPNHKLKREGSLFALIATGKSRKFQMTGAHWYETGVLPPFDAKAQLSRKTVGILFQLDWIDEETGQYLLRLIREQKESESKKFSSSNKTP